MSLGSTSGRVDLISDVLEKGPWAFFIDFLLEKKLAFDKLDTRAALSSAFNFVRGGCLKMNFVHRSN